MTEEQIKQAAFYFTQKRIDTMISKGMLDLEYPEKLTDEFARYYENMVTCFNNNINREQDPNLTNLSSQFR